MTREQEERIALIALQSGRVAVRPPYSNGAVEVTIPSGETWLLSLGGRPVPRPFNHSVDWVDIAS